MPDDTNDAEKPADEFAAAGYKGIVEVMAAAAIDAGKAAGFKGDMAMVIEPEGRNMVTATTFKGDMAFLVDHGGEVWAAGPATKGWMLKALRTVAAPEETTPATLEVQRIGEAMNLAGCDAAITSEKTIAVALTAMAVDKATVQGLQAAFGAGAYVSGFLHTEDSLPRPLGAELQIKAFTLAVKAIENEEAGKRRRIGEDTKRSVAAVVKDW